MNTNLAGGIADRDTPLIKNCWYILDWSADVGHELKNRTILNQDLVYFRAKSGEVAALQNRCAHRCFPLHRSTLHDDDTIQCGYHGLIYNTQGQCVKIPSAPAQNPDHIKIQHYPIADRAPVIWIWPGDPEKADPDLIPDFDWLQGDEWGFGTGYYHVKGNYLAIHENLMDITHFFYLHGSLVGSPQHTEAKITVTVEGNTVDNYRVNEGEPVPKFHSKATGLADDVLIVRHAHSIFKTPGFHDGVGDFEDAAGTNNGRTNYHPRILHFMTPESQYTTHYWWVFARDFTPDSTELDQFYNAATSKLFEEDKDAIEWIEAQWANDDRPGFREDNVPADEGAVKMRRIVQRLAQAESEADA